MWIPDHYCRARSSFVSQLFRGFQELCLKKSCRWMWVSLPVFLYFRHSTIPARPCHAHPCYNHAGPAGGGPSGAIFAPVNPSPRIVCALFAFLRVLISRRAPFPPKIVKNNPFRAPFSALIGAFGWRKWVGVWVSGESTSGAGYRPGVREPRYRQRCR